MKRIARLTGVLWVCFLVGVGAHAQTQATPPQGDILVTAEGEGPSVDSATLAAKRNALEEGIGTQLLSQTEVANFEVQRDVILTRTVGAVKRYEVDFKEQLSDGSYRVRIRATVSMASIREDLAALKILLESMDKPRMMVVVDEGGGTAAAGAIVDFLNEKGFRLVDPAQAAALLNRGGDLVDRAVAGNAAAAARLGAANGAEYILVGKVTSTVGDSPLMASSGMKSGQAALSARVIDCSTAAIVTAKSATGAAVHLSDAVAMSLAAEKAGSNLMDRGMFEKIVAEFQEMVNNGVELAVTVSGVTTYAHQKKIRGALGGMGQVVSVQKRRFANKTLALTVHFRGNADGFADALDGRKAGGRRISVTGVTGNRITAELNDK